MYRSLNEIIKSPISYRPQVVGPYNLRREPLLQTPFVRSRQSQRYIHYRGVKVWNEIDLSIRNSRTLFSFKKKLKVTFLGSY